MRITKNCFIAIMLVVFSFGLISCKHQTIAREFKLTGSTLPPTFLLGSHLCRFPMPPTKELIDDMDNLKSHGFNLIKLQTHWAVDEPLEGKYEFERYDTLIQHAKELGMYVYMGFTLEQAPAWLYSKYPDCRMVGKNGLPLIYETQYTLPSDGKPGPCFDHPEAMEKQLTYITAFVKHFSKYENILVWNTWQEIAYWAESQFGSDICYCDNTQKHFREWLKTKYGTLANLNRCWGANFGDWEQVAPHRQEPIGMAVDKDFSYFMENDYVARTLKARYMAIKEADPVKRAVFAHKGGVNIGSGQDWTYARCEDFMGSSTYPAWSSFRPWDDNAGSRVYPPKKYQSLYNEMWSNLALSFDYLRCANPDNNPVWAAEFQGGPVMSGFQKGRVPSAEDMRRWMLTTIGSGVTTISFWVTRAEIMAQENNGFSLLDSRGDSTERLSEVSKIGLALRAHSDLFALPSKPKSKAAIIINEENYQFCKTFYGTERHLSYSIRGWYHLLWRNGYPVDFVNITDIDSTTSGQYKVLILPFPLSLSDKLALKLKDFISGGGNLICEGAAGRLSENSLAVRGEMSPVIAGLAGVEQKSFIEVNEPGGGRRWTPEERTWGEFENSTYLEGSGEFAGTRTLANYYLQTFTCKGGTPIFKAGEEVAACENRTGKGKIWLFGTLVGHNGTAYDTPGTLVLVNKIMKLSDVEPQKIGDLLVQKRIKGNMEAWIITNPTEADIAESIDIRGMKNPEVLIGDKWEINGMKAKIRIKSLDIIVVIFEKS
jgi:beta-galactosidase